MLGTACTSYLRPRARYIYASCSPLVDLHACSQGSRAMDHTESVSSHQVEHDDWFDVLVVAPPSGQMDGLEPRAMLHRYHITISYVRKQARSTSETWGS